MKYPNFEEEKKLWRAGYKFVAGLDEAGRGPLAGPVVAAAVVFFRHCESQRSNLTDSRLPRRLRAPRNDILVKDSKQLTAKQREEIYNKIIKNKNIKYGVGAVSEKIIDKINILEATKLAMVRAVASLRAKRSNLKAQIASSPRQGGAPRNDEHFLIDGNFKLDKLNILQKSIIKGDQKVMSIAAASIIAKVTRDRMMKKYHKKYPRYGFDRHKGYGTKAHFLSLEKFGPCKIHRKSFYPISSYPQA